MKTNEQPDCEKSCLRCIHFRSFEDIYEDDLEPFEIGWCYHPDSPSYEIASDEVSCDKFEKEEND